MSFGEITLIGIIVSLVSAIIGYILGQRGKVSDKMCLERQSHIQENFCLQMNSLTDSIEQLRKDINGFKGRS